MYRRHVERAVHAALSDTRVVLLNGARQTGKSTLAQALAAERGGQYVTLDDPAVAGVARADPAALIGGAGDFLVIDEVQQAPALFAALKRTVDRDRRPGRFLLTGSANVLLLPRLAESLAGRMEIVSLEPLAQCELAGSDFDLLGSWLAGRPPGIGRLPLDRADVCRRLLAGGFPEAVARTEGARRDAWFRSYITSLLQRDVRDLANIEGLTELPRLLALLAARSSTLLNMAELSRACGVAHSTLRRYLALLETTFLLRPLPAWSANIGKRLVKSPKVHLLDSGLAAHLRGDGNAAALAQSPAIGPLLETFVVHEVRKQIGFGAIAATPYHFRSAAGQEVDLVVESSDRRVVGIEVKAAATLSRADISGLLTLAAAAGSKFVCGIVLYLGEQRLPLADRIWAVPISALWLGDAAGRAVRRAAKARSIRSPKGREKR